MRTIRHSPLMTYGRFAGLALVVGVAVSAARADDAELEIAQVFSKIDAALSSRNAEGALTFFSDHYLAEQPPMTKGEMRTKLKALCISAARVTSKHEIIRQVVQGDYANVVTRTTLTIARPGAEDVNSVSTLKYRLARSDGGWRIVTRAVLDEHDPAPEPGGEHRVPEFGVAVKLPKTWTPSLIEPPAFGGQRPAILELDSPCLGAVMRVSVVSMPMPLEPAQLAEMCSDHLKNLCPDATVGCAKIERKVVIKGCADDKADNCCEIRLVWEQPKSDLAEFNEIVVRKRGADMVVFELQVPRRTQVDTFQPDFDQLVNSMTISEAAPADPSRGRVVGHAYENNVFGVKVSFPNDWTVTTTRAFSFSVNAQSPCGKGSITLAGVQLPQQVTAKRALDGDESVIAEYDPTYRRLERGTTFLANRRWESSLSLTSSGGVERKRWRLYAVDDGKLIVVMCDANPPEAFAAFEPVFKESIGSLTLSPPAIDRDGKEAASFATPPKD